MSYFPIVLYPLPVKKFLKSIAGSAAKIPATPSPPTRARVIEGTAQESKGAIAILQIVIAVNFALLIASIFLLPQTTIGMAVILGASCTYTLITAWEKRSEFYPTTPPDLQAKQLEEYERQLAAYNRAASELMIAKHQHLLAIDACREQLAQELSQKVMKPAGYSDAPQGASEAKFRTYLEKYFPKKIHQGFKIPIPGHKRNYSTDFTYIDKSLNLYVDIEIDEVYYYKNKKPTHCCDDDHDQIRNLFFLSNNWVVIRFAEEQIIYYPNRCCKVIATVVAILTGERDLIEKFKDVPDLPNVKHWSTKEARQMARLNYRGTLFNKVAN